jgi:hypothetical protein
MPLTRREYPNIFAVATLLLHADVGDEMPYSGCMTDANVATLLLIERRLATVPFREVVKYAARSAGVSVPAALRDVDAVLHLCGVKPRVAPTAPIDDWPPNPDPWPGN